MTSDGSTAPAKFAYTARDQLSSITPHGGSAIAIISHGTGQEDLAAIGTEEVIQNVLGVASTGTGTGASYYTRDSSGQLLAKRKPGEKPTETQYYLLDSFGSPAMLTSSTGTQTAPASGTYQYDSYGNPIGTGPSTFGYRSGQILPDGLIHYGARYYDPANANWTQGDPINQASDLTQADRYSYVGDDPVNESDPSGRCFILSCKEYHEAERYVSRTYESKYGDADLVKVLEKGYEYSDLKECFADEGDCQAAAHDIAEYG